MPASLRPGPGTIASIGVAAAVVFGVAVLTETGGPEFILWLTDLGEAFPPLLAGLFGLMVTRRFGTGNRLGKTTLLASFGFLAWGLGEVAWSVIELGLGESPFPSVADAGFLAFYPFIGAAAVCVFAFGPRVWHRRLGVYLAPIAFAGAVAVAGTLHPLAASADADALTVWLSIAYPTLDVVLLILVVAVTVVLRSSNSNAGGYWIIAGIITLTAADFSFSVQVLTTGELAAGWPDVLWFAGFTLGATGFGLVFRSLRSASFATSAATPSVLRPGRVYSIAEPRPTAAIQIAARLSKAGRPVLLLTGSPVGVALVAGVKESEIVPLTDVPGVPRGVSPSKLSTITDLVIKAFSSEAGTFVVIDCLDRLLLYSDIESVMRLGFRLGDIASVKSCGMIVSYDRRWIDQRFAALLERSTEALNSDSPILLQENGATQSPVARLPVAAPS